MISVIICSIDTAKFAAVEATYAAHMGAAPYEIVGVHDARSLCEGYNRGLRRARGDVCVFSHDDIEILSDELGGTLERHLASWDVVGVAGTTRMHAMGWANSGIRYARGVVYDTDFTFRCHLAGYRLAVCLDIRLIHFSEGTVDDAWQKYADRFREKHAAHLVPDAAPWLEVRKRVQTREEIIASYDMTRLRGLTEEIRRRA